MYKILWGKHHRKINDEVESYLEMLRTLPAEISITEVTCYKVKSYMELTRLEALYAARV